MRLTTMIRFAVVPWVPILLGSLFVVIAFQTTLSAQFGLDQQRISESEWRRGFHGFNMIVEGNGLEPITLQQFQSSNASDVLLIVMGRLDRLPVNVTNHVNNGGAALIASDSTARFSFSTFAGFRFVPLKVGSRPSNDRDAFGGMKDCPVVRDFQTHPVVSGVTDLVTNGPGCVQGDRETTLARLPAGFGPVNSRAIIAARGSRNGGRAVAIGDQSIFTNQMIIYGDNALFADQTVKWLKGGDVKKVLVLVDRYEQVLLDPSDVAVDVPAPSQKEVLDALTNLPPDAMLDFGNSVATVIEDEDLINNFIRESMDNVPDSVLRQFYLFLMFFVACFALVAAFVFQGKLQRQTASGIAVKKSLQREVELKAIRFRERQRAAYVLLDRFCMDVADRRFSDWPSFPTGLNVDEDRKSKNLFKSMMKMSVQYKSKSATFWTTQKLTQLEKAVAQWRAYFEDRPAAVDSELVQSQNRWSTEQLPEDIQ